MTKKKPRKKLPPLVKYWVTNPINNRRLRANGKAHHRLVRDGKMPVPGGRYVDPGTGKIRLKRGRASGTYTFNVVLRLKNHNTGKVLRLKNKNERRSTKTLTLLLKDGEELTNERIMERIEREQVDLNTRYEYEDIDFDYVETHGVDGVLVDLGNISSLANIVVHGERFKYFHDIEESQDDINSGTCGIDCIVARVRKVLTGDHGHHIPRVLSSPVYFINWFQENVLIEEGYYSMTRPWSPEDGLTMEELNRFIDSPQARGLISLYIISPDDKIVMKNVKDHSQMSLTLRINGSHVYLLNRKNLHLVKENNFIRFGEEWPSPNSMKEGYKLVDGSQFRDLIGSDLIQQESENGFIVCGMDHAGDRKQLTYNLVVCTNSFLPIKFNDHGINELKLPDGRFVIFRSESKREMSFIQNIQSKLMENFKLPFIGSLTKFPTITQLTRWYFFNTLGVFPKSRFNTELGDLFEKYKRGGYLVKTRAIEEDEVEIDQSKAYSNVLVTNQYRWCVFDVLDQRESFNIQTHYRDGELMDGYYVVNREINFLWFHSPIIGRLYPKSFVMYALKHNAIRISDISEAIIPNRTLHHDFFKQSVLDLFESLGTGESKDVINPFTGMLGITQRKSYHGAICDSYEVAASMHGREIFDSNEKVIPHIQRLNDEDSMDLYKLHMVSYSRMEQLYEHHGPIYAQIVYGGIIEHLEMSRRCHECGLRVIGSQVDACYLDTCNLELVQDMVEKYNTSLLLPNGIGSYKIEKSRRKNEVPMPITDEIDPDETKWSFVDNKEYEEGECFITGGPGHGKSTELKRQTSFLKDSEYIVLTTKTTVRDQLIREKGITGEVLTFANLHERSKHQIGSIAHFLSRFTHIFVDEAPTLSPGDWALLFKAKRKSKEPLIVVLFGDENQTRPIVSEDSFASNVYDTMNCKSIMNLVGCRRVELPYILESARYDLALRDLVHGFLLDPVLPKEDDILSTIDTNVKRHVVFTNRKKKQVDKLIMDKFNENREVMETIQYKGKQKQQQDVNLSIGLPFIARENDKQAKLLGFDEDDVPDRVSNSERFIVSEIDKVKRKLMLTFRYDESKHAVVTFSQLMKSYELDFAISAHRAQSITIDEQLQIHLESVRSMTFESLYVAMSRNRRRDQVSFSCTNEKQRKLMAGSRIEKLPYKHDPVRIDDIKPVSVVMYEITNSQDDAVYRGLTKMCPQKMKEVGIDVAAEIAAYSRFQGHIRATTGTKLKMRVDQKIKELGPKHFDVKILHYAFYESDIRALDDETYFINEIQEDRSLNDRQRIENKLKRDAKVRCLRDNVKSKLISRDILLPRITSRDVDHVDIKYYDSTKHSCERKKVRISRKRKLEDVEKTNEKLKKHCTEIIKVHYSSNMFPTNNNTDEYISKMIIEYRS